ncbi:MAG TPA: NAD(P)-dependent oxidoreductase [Candidatus Binatia bacterium]|nr:NAD(P)-dependent oxidoreductase [Candidatus Binatia bacterium]
MRVVVTGGSGRLGQYVIRELFSHGHAVCSLDAIKPRECLCPTYTVDLSRFQQIIDHFKNVDALVHLARIRFPYTENGFNAARQEWQFDDVAGDAERFNQNIAITNNVLAAAEICGVQRIVCGSSLAVYGFYYGTTELRAEYLPVDEEHPRRPQDPYGLTKFIAEQLCDALSHKNGSQIASLRFAGIYTEAHRSMLLERKKNPLTRGTGALWSYIDARDAARACRLALEATFSGHQTFNICASTTMMDTPTLELLARYLPDVRDLRPGLGGCSSGYSVIKARSVLGFEFRCSLLS